MFFIGKRARWIRHPHGPDAHHGGPSAPHDHGGRRGHHRHGPAGRLREHRLFDHGDLRLVIMALLAETPRHGYDVIKVLEDRVGGGYSPSPGVVYPTLTLLEEIGHAGVSEERGRKLYAISPEGQAFLDANRAALDGVLARIEAGSTTRRGPPDPLVRAIENLNTAVRLRFKGRTATETQVRAAAAAIDAAATAVEQL